MNTLKKAFDLLDNFSSLKQSDQDKKIKQVEKLLRAAIKKQSDALLAVREVDQIQKQLAYMLISSGKIDDGINHIKSLVAECNGKIVSMHEEMAFQLCEAAIAAFRNDDPVTGSDLTKQGLAHAGQAKQISRTVLKAFELLQQHQEKAK